MSHESTPSRRQYYFLWIPLIIGLTCSLIGCSAAPGTSTSNGRGTFQFQARISPSSMGRGDLTVSASCGSGEQLLGGGLFYPVENPSGVLYAELPSIRASYPSSPSEWSVVYTFPPTGGSVADRYIVVDAYCALSSTPPLGMSGHSASIIPPSPPNPYGQTTISAVKCPTNTVMTGGGFYVSQSTVGTGFGDAGIIESMPSVNASTGFADGWQVRDYLPDTSGDVFVLCASQNLAPARALDSEIQFPCTRDTPCTSSAGLGGLWLTTLACGQGELGLAGGYSFPSGDPGNNDLLKHVYRGRSLSNLSGWSFATQYYGDGGKVRVRTACFSVPN
jgi:hypothetical protein